MKNYNISVIPGDGIGPEVIAEGIKVLDRVAELDSGFAFEYTYYPWGCKYYLETGMMMPENGLEQLSQSDAILLGAVGFPGGPDHISLRELLLVIRKEFDQYINLRPVKLLRGAECILKTLSAKILTWCLYVRTVKVSMLAAVCGCIPISKMN